MTKNDEITYLTFVNIENILDKYKIEYQSLNKRIEFTLDNDEQIIIHAERDNSVLTNVLIHLFHKQNQYTFSFEGNENWINKKDNTNLYEAIENLINP